MSRNGATEPASRRTESSHATSRARTSPVDGNNNPKTFHPYRRAKTDLLERIGGYCSYCERTGDLHIEHVAPRRQRPDLTEDWTNFLLGCANCNGTKGNRNQSRDGYLWPDQDDTEGAFEYLPDGIVKVRNDLPELEGGKARRLFELVGLGCCPAGDPCARDLRWRDRREAWRQAAYARQRVEDGADIIDEVIALAKAIGFWSVWMTVFAGQPQVCDLLRLHFPGTR